MVPKQKNFNDTKDFFGRLMMDPGTRMADLMLMDSHVARLD